MTAPQTSAETPPQAPRDGTELIRQFLPMSPFVNHLRISAVELERDRASILLPWDESLATYGDVVHGGAISALVDITAMATAWSGAELPEKLRGVTVSLSIDYVDAARAEDLVAEGAVVRRGRTLTSCEVDVRGADGRTVAKALATYKVG